MFWDAHAHLDDEQFATGLDSVVEAMRTAGIDGVINAACDLPSCRTSMQLAQRYPWCWFTAGIHPHYAGDVQPADYQEVANYAAHPRCVAIGEIGLDYHYDFSPREAQQQVFLQQLQLAHALHMPIVLHVREAYQDANRILADNRHLLTDGVLLHCYSGSMELARDFYTPVLDCYYSFGGAVTFAKDKQAVLSVIPRDRLLLETDCPYMTPAPYRGRRNDPSYIPVTAQAVASMLDCSVEQLAKQTTANTLRFYRITGNAD